MKRILSILTAFIMLVTLIPLSSSASTFASEQATTDGVTLFGFADVKLSNGISSIVTPRAFLGFNSENPSVVQSTLTMNNKVSFAAENVNGIIYAFAHTYTSESDVPTAETLYRITPYGSSWASSQIGNGHYDYSVLDMTYAADTDTLYAIVLDEIDGHLLVTVDRNTGNFTTVADLSEIGVACVPTFTYIGNGEFFTVAHSGGRGLIFNREGIVRELSVTLNDAYDYLSAVTYYAPHGCLYGAIFRSIPAGSFGILVRIDPVTGEAAQLGTIGTNYGYSLTSLFAIPDFEIDTPSTPAQEDIDAALNREGSSLSFINDATLPWEIISEASRTYMGSGNVSNDGSTSKITAVFNGLTTGQVLSFDWSVSSENNYDWLNFLSNGNVVDRISGSQSWSTYTYTIPANGDYTFEWAYSKDISASNGDDRGYIDNVSISGQQPAPYDPAFLDTIFDDALNVNDGSLDFNNDISNPWVIDNSEPNRISVRSTVTQDNYHQAFYIMVTDAQAGDAISFDWKADTDTYDRLLFKKNSAIMSHFSNNTEWQHYTFIIPESGSFVFTWEYYKDNIDSYGYTGTVWVDNIKYVANYGDDPANPNIPDAADFDSALNAAGQTRHFENDSDHPWQIVSIDGRTCAVSDTAGMPETYTIFTTDIGYVEAGTTITFDWKTSCELGWDRISLTLNGYACMSASGMTEWTSQSYTIDTDGYYVIGWQYEKNWETDEGSDCAWVDNIVIQTVQTGVYHTVTFIDGVNGSVISTVEVPDGGTVTPPEPPTHAGYDFAYWDGQLNNITSDRIITAVYTIIEPPSILMGDVDGDGVVSVSDAVDIMRHALGLAAISEEYLPAADMDGLDGIEINDAVLAMRTALGLI